MRLSRLSLLCLLSISASVIMTSVTAGPFEDYLSANGNPAPNNNNYGLLSTPQGMTLVEQHKGKASGYLRLSAANLLLNSTAELVSGAEIEEGKGSKVATDKTLAHQIIDRGAAATELAIGDGTQISGAGTSATNKIYCNLAFTTATSLVERLAVDTDLAHGPNVILMLRYHFKYSRNNEIKQEKDFEANPLQKLRFQLHALAYAIFHTLRKGSDDPFTQLKQTYIGFDTTLTALESFKQSIGAAVERYKSPSGLSQNMAAIFSADQQQRYFDRDNNGVMRSLPRAFLFPTSKDLSKEGRRAQRNPAIVIYNATLNTDFTAKEDISRGLVAAGFVLRRPEDIQNALVIAAIERQQNPKTSPIPDPKTIGHDILKVMDNFVIVAPLLTPGPARFSVVTDVFIRKGSVLYQQERKEREKNKVGKGDGGTPAKAKSSASSPTPPADGRPAGGGVDVASLPSSPPPPSSPASPPLPTAHTVTATTTSSSSSAHTAAATTVPTTPSSPENFVSNLFSLFTSSSSSSKK